MDWLKWIGAGLILFSGAGLGGCGCEMLREREHSLGEILRMFTLLKEEIRFGNLPFREAFVRTGRKMQGKMSEFLLLAAEKMEKGGTDPFSVVFRDCARESLKDFPFTKEERELFFSAGEYLGYLDLKSQLRELEHLELFFQDSLREARDGIKEKMKLYRSLGILGAFLVVILIW